MSFAVDNPILNNPFEEPKEYWIYDKVADAEHRGILLIKKLLSLGVIRSEGRVRNIRYLLA